MIVHGVSSWYGLAEVHLRVAPSARILLRGFRLPTAVLPRVLVRPLLGLLGRRSGGVILPVSYLLELGLPTISRPGDEQQDQALPYFAEFAVGCVFHSPTNRPADETHPTRNSSRAQGGAAAVRISWTTPPMLGRGATPLPAAPPLAHEQVRRDECGQWSCGAGVPPPKCRKLLASGENKTGFVYTLP
jgi:hypothetical protein